MTAATNAIRRGVVPGPPLRTISTVPHAITTASPSAPITQPHRGFSTAAVLIPPTSSSKATRMTTRRTAVFVASAVAIDRADRAIAATAEGIRRRDASSFLDTLRRQTVPYTAMAFPKVRRWPHLLCVVGVSALLGQGVARAGKNDLQLGNLCAPGTNTPAGLSRPECGWVERDGAGRITGVALGPDAESSYRSLMSELGVAIAPRLMTPADRSATLGSSSPPSSASPRSATRRTSGTAPPPSRLATRWRRAPIRT